jgi:hypothetical protein
MDKNASLDNSESMDQQVSFEDVKNEIKTFAKHEIGTLERTRCHQCGKESNYLEWFKFRTSANSWRNECGAEGFYSKCPDCDVKGSTIITMRN